MKRATKSAKIPPITPQLPVGSRDVVASISALERSFSGATRVFHHVFHGLAILGLWTSWWSMLKPAVDPTQTLLWEACMVLEPDAYGFTRCLLSSQWWFYALV
eukprot:FR740260.1.p1 GENE.FR740260.1~~FR740260.1.p1  ORF type:complete len:103 (-),score=1.93 FR740260.1:163-471(-)